MILSCTSSTLASSYVYILGDSGFGACIRKCLKQWLTWCFNSEPYGCICHFNTTLFPSHSFQKCSLITTNTDWISTDYRSAESQAMSFVRYTFNLKQYHIFRWVFLQLNVITSTKVLGNEMRTEWNVQHLIISWRVGTGPFPFLYFPLVEMWTWMSQLGQCRWGQVSRGWGAKGWKEPGSLTLCIANSRSQLLKPYMLNEGKK